MNDDPPYGWDSLGNPITDEYVAKVLEEAEDGFDPATFQRVEPGTMPEFRMAGRPSLTGERRESPRVTFRMADGLRERAEAEAQRRGCSVSQLAREALEQFLAS